MGYGLITPAAQALLFVTRENLTRNHYSTSQRALIGARLKVLFEEQAKKRQIEAAKAGGRKTEDDYQRSSVTKVEKKVPVQVPEPSVKGDSRDLAGDSVNVGAKVIDRADKVIKQGAPELVRAVERGTVSVSAAAILRVFWPDICAKFCTISPAVLGRPRRSPC